MQVLIFFFFLEDSSTILLMCFVSIVVGNESDNNSDVTYDRGSQNRKFREEVTEKQRIRKEGVREAAGSQRRGPRSGMFAKKGSAEQKV